MNIAVFNLIQPYADKFGIEIEHVLDLLETLLVEEVPYFEETSFDESYKWVLASCLQKAIRRGDEIEALRMASSMIKSYDMCNYMWRRLGVISAEEIGVANFRLMCDVLFLVRGFSTKKFFDYQKQVVYPLIVRMCKSDKSRLLCDLYVIDDHNSKLISEGKSIIDLNQVYADTPSVEDFSIKFGVSKSLVKLALISRFSTDGLSDYIRSAYVYATGFMKERLDVIEFGDYELIGGFPEYGIDQHTKQGKGALVYMTGFSCFKKYLQNCNDKIATLGEILFNVEGGKLDRALVFIGEDNVKKALKEAEMSKFGLSEEDREGLMSAMEAELKGLVRYARRKKFN